MDTLLVFEKNKENAEVAAYTALYSYLNEGQEENLKIWRNFCDGAPVREILRLQREFLLDIENIMFTRLVRPVLNFDGEILLFGRSLAIAKIQGIVDLHVDEFESIS